MYFDYVGECNMIMLVSTLIMLDVYSDYVGECNLIMLMSTLIMFCECTLTMLMFKWVYSDYDYI